MSEAPLVSVVLSVHNGAAYLEEALQSIRRQTFCDFEFLVINDGSTDATRQILDRHAREDRRLRVFDEPARGLITSLNLGCRRARGKYLARMDADDVAVPQRLERQVEFLESHPAVGVVGGCVEYLLGGEPSGKYWTVPGSHAAIMEILARHNCLIHPTVMMRRDCFERVGGYRPAFIAAEDYDLWLRMGEQSELANLSCVLLLYRFHPEQVSVQHICQQTLSHEAAIFAARRRREGGADPFADGHPITLPRLLEAGVPSDRIRAALLTAPVSQAAKLIQLGQARAARAILDELEAHLAGLNPSRSERSEIAWSRSRCYRTEGNWPRRLGCLLTAYWLNPRLLTNRFRRGRR